MPTPSKNSSPKSEEKEFELEYAPLAEHPDPVIPMTDAEMNEWADGIVRLWRETQRGQAKK